MYQVVKERSSCVACRENFNEHMAPCGSPRAQRQAVMSNLNAEMVCVMSSLNAGSIQAAM